jgi:hypothetical protein
MWDIPQSVSAFTERTEPRSLEGCLPTPSWLCSQRHIERCQENTFSTHHVNSICHQCKESTTPMASFIASARLSSTSRRASRRSTKAASSCTAKRTKGMRKNAQHATLLQHSPTVTIPSKAESKEDDRQAQCERLQALSAAMMNDVFCGELRPSLTSFSIKAGGCESRAIDFFFNNFAPAQKILRIAINASLHTSDPLITAAFPLALYHEELFHAVVTISLCSMESQSFYESDGQILSQPSPNIFYHRQWALNFLRHKLTPPWCYADNAAILTTTTLLLIDVSLKLPELFPHKTDQHRVS